MTDPTSGSKASCQCVVPLCRQRTDSIKVPTVGAEMKAHSPQVTAPDHREESTDSHSSQQSLQSCGFVHLFKPVGVPPVPIVHRQRLLDLRFRALTAASEPTPDGKASIPTSSQQLSPRASHCVSPPKTSDTDEQQDRDPAGLSGTEREPGDLPDNAEVAGSIPASPTAVSYVPEPAHS